MVEIYTSGLAHGLQIISVSQYTFLSSVVIFTGNSKNVCLSLFEFLHIWQQEVKHVLMTVNQINL